LDESFFAMKGDVLKWLEGSPGDKRPSKETLNHPGIIRLASGLDPFRQTPEAYLRAYEALGIDMINVVPEANAPAPAEPGEVILRGGGRVQESYLGVFNTSSRVRFPYRTVEEFWAADLSSLTYDSLDLPGAQYWMPCTREAIERKQARVGQTGLYYYQWYTTLFMWGVEALGWEVFLTAAASDPQRFDRRFLQPMFEKTRRGLELLSSADSPWVFCHDDIAMATGPCFRPEWYETYIYPRYAELWEIPHRQGKKVFFVADGKLDWALEPLRRTGCDGIMFESPATSLEAVRDVWGDAFYIGGIDAGLLTRGSPEEVRRHVAHVCNQTRDDKGFALCCSGGLAGNIPLENLEAYFDARVENGFTPAGWRHSG
jgi:hypothetical protein